VIELDFVSHQFETPEGPIPALSGVSLDIGATEFVAVVGPSGCGKSTLLRLIAGLVTPSAGSIRIKGEKVTKPTADVGLVFQAPTLLPWANVLDNVLFPLRMLNEYGPQGEKRARELLALAGLAGFENRMPDELSGGMQQRVAICRGLVRDPAVLLMDEPFAALDALTRDEMGALLLDLWAAKPKAILFITHSVPEAVMLADRVIVMGARPGRIVDDVRIDLPRPRNFDMESCDEFQAATKRIRAHVYRGSRHAPPSATQAA
jgi:NitT/TauT family transport system ATP-binding protein